MTVIQDGMLMTLPSVVGAGREGATSPTSLTRRRSFSAHTICPI